MGETRTQAKYPVMYRVKQRFAEEAILDIPAAIFAELDRIGLKEKIKPGMEIGVTCGSRGINHIALIIKTACDYIRLAGGQPFILPAMGSHGGATAEGQAHVCEKFGVTEDYVGCPIRSSMDVVQLPDTPEGIPVFVSKTGIGHQPRQTPYRFYGPQRKRRCKNAFGGLGQTKRRQRHAR